MRKFYVNKDIKTNLEPNWCAASYEAPSQEKQLVPP